jgi:hypothetical protein
MYTILKDVKIYITVLIPLYKSTSLIRKVPYSLMYCSKAFTIFLHNSLLDNL